MSTPVETSAKILLAEDDNDMRRFLVKALRPRAIPSPVSTMGCLPTIVCARSRSNSC